jgi:hypothetical protein
MRERENYKYLDSKPGNNKNDCWTKSTIRVAKQLIIKYIFK